MAEPSDIAPALAAFLAERDIPCPRCGYNLRGCAGTGCPECGAPFALTLAGVGGRTRMWLLITVFGFGLALAGAAATRAVRDARGQAVGAGFSTVVVTQTPTTGASSSIRSFGGAAGSNIVVPAPWPGSGGQSWTSISGTGTVTLRSIQTAGPPNWNAVAEATWTRLGWWGGLALVSIAGMVLAVGMRRSLSHPERWRSMVVLAWFVGLSLVASHAIALAREMT